MPRKGAGQNLSITHLTDPHIQFSHLTRPPPPPSQRPLRLRSSPQNTPSQWSCRRQSASETAGNLHAALACFPLWFWNDPRLLDLNLS